MKFSDKALRGILAALLVAGVFVWVAWAQNPITQPSSTLTSSTLDATCPACPACPATSSTTVSADAGNHSCLSLAGTAVYMDSPAVLLAKAEAIGLSEVQIQTLLGIVEKSRQEALAVLTSEQKGILGQISSEPVVIGAILPEAQTQQTSALSSSGSDGSASLGTSCPAAATTSTPPACCSAEATQ